MPKRSEKANISRNYMLLATYGSAQFCQHGKLYAAVKWGGLLITEGWLLSVKHCFCLQ